MNETDSILDVPQAAKAESRKPPPVPGLWPGPATRSRQPRPAAAQRAAAAAIEVRDRHDGLHELLLDLGEGAYAHLVVEAEGLLDLLAQVAADVEEPDDGLDRLRLAQLIGKVLEDLVDGAGGLAHRRLPA